MLEQLSGIIEDLVQSGDVENVRRFLYYLKDEGCPIDLILEVCKTLREKALEHENEPIVAFIRELEGDFYINRNNKADEYGWTDLHEAAEKDNDEIIVLLFNKIEADLAARTVTGWTPLHFAAESMSLKAIEKLVELKPDLINIGDNNGLTPLHLAAEHNRTTSVEKLVELKVDINIQDNSGRSALHAPAENNSKDMVKLLLEKESNANLKDLKGETPLFLAAKNSCVDVAKLLVENENHENSADVNICNNEGYGPLHEAARNNSLAIAEVLLNAGADVHHKADDGGTALHKAAESNSFEIVERLIKKGANVNEATTAEKITPLHEAARNDSVQSAKLLVQAGANVNKGDKFEKTPLMYAENAKVPAFRTMEVLLRAGAIPSTKKETFKNVVKAFVGTAESKENDDLISLIFIMLQLMINCDCEKKHRDGFVDSSDSSQISRYQSLFKTLKEGTKSDYYTRIHDFKEKIYELSKDNQFGASVEHKIIAKRILKTYFMNKLEEPTFKLPVWIRPAVSCLPCIDPATKKRKKFKEDKSEASASSKGCLVQFKSGWKKVKELIPHKCSLQKNLAVFMLSFGIFTYISDLVSDIIVAAEDLGGFSFKLGVCQVILVIFTFIHENVRSSNSLYITEEEVMKIQLGRELVPDDWNRDKKSKAKQNKSKDSDESPPEVADKDVPVSETTLETYAKPRLYKSKNLWMNVVIRLFCPFQFDTKGGFFKRKNALPALYNLLTTLQLRPIIDRLVVFFHEPMQLWVYFRRKGEQNCLKQYYLILEQLPELLIQYYVFQIVLNNLKLEQLDEKASELGDCHHIFNYTRMRKQLDSNSFCNIMLSNKSDLGICNWVFRVFSMSIPFFTIPSGITSLEAAFRNHDPVSKKMSTPMGLILWALYIMMLPARVFLLSTLMHAVDHKEMVMGYAVVRTFIELFYNWSRINKDSDSESGAANLKVDKDRGKGSSPEDGKGSQLKKRLEQIVTLDNLSFFWRLLLFSFRDVFIMSIREPIAYMNSPSSVTHHSIRKASNLMSMGMFFYAEGLFAAAYIETYYPCGQYSYIFVYSGWFLLALLIFSLTIITFGAYLFHPLKGYPANLAKNMRHIQLTSLASIPVCILTSLVFLLNKKRHTIEIVALTVFVLLQLSLNIALLLYIKWLSAEKKKKGESKKIGWYCFNPCKSYPVYDPLGRSKIAEASKIVRKKRRVTKAAAIIKGMGDLFVLPHKSKILIPLQQPLETGDQIEVWGFYKHNGSQFTVNLMGNDSNESYLMRFAIQPTHKALAMNNKTDGKWNSEVRDSEMVSNFETGVWVGCALFT